MRDLLKYDGRFSFRRHAVPRSFILYVARFLGCFLMFYFGTLLIIGLSSEENYYSPFVAHYVDYVTPLRRGILVGANLFVELLGYKTQFVDVYTVAIEGAKGVKMVYSCVGYGVMSFWAAFVIANRGPFFTKLAWLFGGWIILYILNVLRISFLLVANLKHWSTPFELDHHTLFNIVAYGFIFALMFAFDRQQKQLILAR